MSRTNNAAVMPQTALPRRGCRFYVRRVLKWLGISLLALLVLGFAYQTFATESDKGAYPVRGQLYSVNGHRMNLYCSGERGAGNPTVILEAGGVANSLWWYRVQGGLEPHTRVCSYDRAGQGWSEPAAGSRDALTLVNELHTLLEQAGEQSPYIMVGHSFGAILVRIYAQQYPDQVSGIVQVDSGLLIPKQFASQSEFQEWKSSNDILQALLWGMTRVGIIRLMMPAQFEAWGYPPEIVKELAALRSSNQVFDSDYAERLPARWALNEASASAENLGDLPMVVLWGTEGLNFAPADLERLHEFQREIAAYSSNSVSRNVEGADHGTILGKEQYAAQVRDAVLEVITAAQSGQPLTH
ncbi:MAG: alpha/beta hydrolase [Anaerolineae bacterium]|nr:alpha/beta hydrolase [Anaerolineae bacterium]